MSKILQGRSFYGWWIVVAAFLNLFFTTGIVYYGFPVFYPSLIDSLGFSRQQATAGIFFGFVVMAPLFGLLAGALIDRVGARAVILCGIAFVGLSLVFMGIIETPRQYYLLCITEVVGYVLAGPIPNQVLIANWFRTSRGRSMGYAYLGLGLGGAVSPILIHSLIENFGWRRAFEAIGVSILAVLFPVGIWITRSTPREMGLLPDGAASDEAAGDGIEVHPVPVRMAIRTSNFWLLLVGSTLTIGAIGTVTSHFILFLNDNGYSRGWASRGLRCRPFYSKKRDGLILFGSGACHFVIVYRSQFRGSLWIRSGVWFRDGRGLHAYPAGGRGLFRTHVTREIARTHHYGRLAGPDLWPRDGRAHLRYPSQLRSRLGHRYLRRYLGRHHYLFHFNNSLPPLDRRSKRADINLDGTPKQFLEYIKRFRLHCVMMSGFVDWP